MHPRLRDFQKLPIRHFPKNTRKEARHIYLHGICSVIPFFKTPLAIRQGFENFAPLVNGIISPGTRIIAAVITSPPPFPAEMMFYYAKRVFSIVFTGNAWYNLVHIDTLHFPTGKTLPLPNGHLGQEKRNCFSAKI
ncbi:MAG: hypothetical protein IJQ21_10900 [Lachnospiraceae bacterium]|nr:hypothetical protein [Lachnospiraceae bacterium]